MKATPFPRSNRGAGKTGLWILLVIVLLAGAGLWYAVNGAMERRAESAAKAAEAAEVLNARRLELFGERALEPGVEFRTSGLGVRIIEPGEGPNPVLSSTIRITYTGSLKDGRVFDEALEPAEFQLGRLVPGMATGIQLIKPGGKIELFIPPSLGYGNRVTAGIPAGSGLIFDVTLVEIK